MKQLEFLNVFDTCGGIACNICHLPRRLPKDLQTHLPQTGATVLLKFNNISNSLLSHHFLAARDMLSMVWIGNASIACDFNHCLVLILLSNLGRRALARLAMYTMQTRWMASCPSIPEAGTFSGAELPVQLLATSPRIWDRCKGSLWTNSDSRDSHPGWLKCFQTLDCSHNEVPNYQPKTKTADNYWITCFNQMCPNI